LSKLRNLKMRKKSLIHTNLCKAETTSYVTMRKIFAIGVSTSCFLLGAFYLVGYTSLDWQVALVEWMSFVFGELYIITFYFDLGDEYYVEQIREIPRML